MTGGSPRLVAVQAAVVAVLLVVVFVTLLQPDSESPISSIQGPSGGNPTSQLPGPDVYTSAGNQGNGGGPNQPGGGPGNGGPGAGGPGGPGAGGLSGTEGLGLTGPSESLGGGTSQGGGQGTPSDDQYSDMLSRLTLRLN